MCEKKCTPTVGDVLDLLSSSLIPESSLWVDDLKKIGYGRDFSSWAFTPDSHYWMLRILRTVIEHSLSLLVRNEMHLAVHSTDFFEMMWNGHLFLEEARQTAFAFAVNADIIYPKISSQVAA